MDKFEEYLKKVGEKCDKCKAKPICHYEKESFGCYELLLINNIIKKGE